MNDDRRFERAAQQWLELGPNQAPDHAVQAVLAAISTTPQERGLRAPWRTLHMSAFVRVGVASAAALSILIASLGLLPWRLPPGPGTNVTATPGPLPPTACPSGSPLPSGTIATIAGTGALASTGDGGPALDAAISVPQSLAVDAAGNIYFGDRGGSVRRIRTDGVMEAFASGLSVPGPVAFGPDGSLFVADNDDGTQHYSTIKRIAPDGTVTTVAGTGVLGSTGDEGPGVQAQINNAGTLAVGPDGSLYFDDSNRYRTIDPAGVIHTFAGTGATGFSGDGGPATDATFGNFAYGEVGVAVAQDGTVYLGDGGNSRVRKVDPSGTIMTVAGNGRPGRAGDGGPAIEAQLNASPYGLGLDASGNLFVADWNNADVRRIDAAGIITTVAGTYQGFSGDCGPATAAAMYGPVAVAPYNGALFIAEQGNDRIRMIVP